MKTLDEWLRELGVERSQFQKRNWGCRGLDPKVRDARAVIARALLDGGWEWAQISEFMGMTHGAWHYLVKDKGGERGRRKRAAVLKKNVADPCSETKRRIKLAFGFPARLVREKAVKAASTEEAKRKMAAGVAAYFSQPEVRQTISRRMRAKWADRNYRVTMETAARTDETRLLRANNAAKFNSRFKHPKLRYPKEGAVVQMKSTWEIRAARILDAFDEVSRWDYEGFRVPVHPTFTIPDFKVVLRDGSVFVVEVKARWVYESDWPGRDLKIKRRTAAEDFCRERGWQYETWFLADIEKLEKIFDLGGSLCY